MNVSGVPALIVRSAHAPGRDEGGEGSWSA